MQFRNDFRFVLFPGAKLQVGLLQPIYFKERRWKKIIMQWKTILDYLENIFYRENFWKILSRSGPGLYFFGIICKSWSHPKWSSASATLLNAWLAVASLGFHLGKEPQENCNYVEHVGSGGIEANSMFAWICMKWYWLFSGLVDFTHIKLDSLLLTS